MAYVLLPRLSRHLRIGASPIQSAHSNGDESGLPTSTNTQVHSNTAHVSDSDDDVSEMSDDGPSAGYTSDSDYSGSDKNTTSSPRHLDKQELTAKSSGRKRLRDDYEDEDGSTNNLEVLAAGGAKRRLRSRKMNSENDLPDEDETSATGLLSKVSSGSSASKANTRKKATSKRRRKRQSKQHAPLPDGIAITDDRLFVQGHANGFIFTFRNRSCTHSPCQAIRPFPSDLSRPNTAQESSPDFDISCVALDSFDMCFYRPLNMVFCRTHNICIPLSSLRGHITSSQIRRRHTGTITGSFGMNTIDPFLAHVASAFGLPLDQVFHSQGPDTKQLLKPIPRMEEPRIYLQCPSCKTWLNRSGKGGWKCEAVIRHLKQPDSKCARLLEILESDRPALKEAYGQRPCGTTGLGDASHIPFVEIFGWSPDTSQRVSSDETFVEDPRAPASPTKLEIDPLSQQYVGICKWNIDFPIPMAEALHELCLLPSSLPFSDSHDSDINDPEETLERGLYEVQHFLRGYLEDSNAFVNLCAVGFRSNLTAG